MNENKYFLVKGRAGLGNRMLCALTGILYARLSGRRLLVDWSDPAYSNDGSNVFHSFFQCSLCSPDDEIPYTDSVSPSIWRGHLRESAIDMDMHYGNVYNSEGRRKFSIDLTKLDYQEEVVIMWTYTEKVDLLRSHFNGAFKEFGQTNTKAILTKLLREDLILNPLIRERVEQLNGNSFSKKTSGVHVRYTDHRAPILAILKKLNKLLKREPELKIFLSTDNIQVKNLFEESYPGVVTTPHWYPTPGLPIHHNQNCPDLIESGIEALVDLYLLAECDYLIIDTSSSFSFLAKLLTKASSPNIFNVKQRDKLLLIRRLIWRLVVRLGLFSLGSRILRY